VSHIQIAFLFFAAIAAGGLLMAGLILAKVKIPPILPIGHGLGGLAALGFLFWVNLQGGDATLDRAWWALVVFAAGFVGGLLFFRVLFKNAAPLFLIAGHGSVAAVGLYLLYGVAF
jgi:hypothetical protein